ncbi:MAG: sulfurtransferase TusA family protein [Planctomycetota bacterium]|jgi:sulfite reductase (ferredoxin)
MAEIRGPILRLPETVRQDILGYRSQVEKFLAGQTTPAAFRAYRVPMGIYEQRLAGRYMVRVRIGAGLVSPCQLERIAQLSKTHANGIIHVTTRQDIQIHQVDIEDTPDVLEGLLEVGLSARGGGGNTVRNVTACPRAGVCPKEKFDVAPYAIAAAEYLLQARSSFNLPRKYKIAFSGCSADCAFASVADLGFFAHNKDGQSGFAVYAGGGLGLNPAVAVKIEDFVKDSDIFEVAEAVKRLFDKHGDRSNKHKARLRYVLAGVGLEKFIDLYKNERVELNNLGLHGDIPQIRDITSGLEASEPHVTSDSSHFPSHGNLMPEKNKGLFTLRVGLRHGDIPADDLATVGRIAQEFGQGLVRTTQLQEMLITGVRQDNLTKVNDELAKLGINPVGNDKTRIVTCTGAATCKLGLCLSRGLASAILDKLSGGADTVIRISGCPNSCGHHYIADIGFQGKAKRVKGRLMPCYDVLVGARIVEGNAHLARSIGTVPAKRIPAMLAEAFETGTTGQEKLVALVGKYADLSLAESADDYYYDYGSSEQFSLAGRGPGECGAGVMDVIRLDIDEAKEALEAAHQVATAAEKNENVYKAIVAAARSLLVTFGLEPKKDREIFSAFSDHLIEPGWVKSETRQLLNQAVDWRTGDRTSIDDLATSAGNLIKRVEELFVSLDANLKFRVQPVSEKGNAKKSEPQHRAVDLRGVACPLNFVKAKLELEKVDVGEVLDVLLDDGEPVRNVPDSFAQQGQEVVETQCMGDYFLVTVRRKK